MIVLMKNIITAINNSELNEKIEKEANLKIIGKDIQYKEGILEFFEKKNNEKINIIIINEKLEGQIKFNKVIKIIKNKSDIIIIVKNNNKNMIEKKENIYYTSKINIKIIKEIIKINENNRKEIIKNNKIITIAGNKNSGKSTIALQTAMFLNELNKKILIIEFSEKQKNIFNELNKKKLNKKQIKNKIIIKNKLILKNKIDKKIIIKRKIKKIKNNLYILNIKKEELKNNKIKELLNDNLNEISLNYDYIIIEIKINIYNNLNKKIIKKSENNFIVFESNLLDIKISKKIIKKYIEEFNIKKEYIKIILNKVNKYSIEKEIIKKCFENIEIITSIKYSDIYTLLINKKYKNWNIKNKKIKKEYIPIIKNK